LIKSFTIGTQPNLQPLSSPLPWSFAVTNPHPEVSYGLPAISQLIHTQKERKKGKKNPLWRFQEFQEL
jgi:hypothetical protein